MTEATSGERRRRWPLVVVGLVLLAGAVVPISVERDREFWRTLGDAAHAPMLAAVALVTLAALPIGWRTRRRLIVAGLISVLVAAAIELGQPFVARTASMTDLINGMLGAAGALSGWLAWTSGGRRARGVHAVLALAIVAVVAWPAWSEWRALRWRERQFPLLGDFEQPVELPLWTTIGRSAGTRIAVVDAPTSHGRSALEVRTVSGQWSGISFNAGAGDWSRMRRLRIDIHNPAAESFILRVRVDDMHQSEDYHSRFNGERRIDPGWNEIEIPLATIERGPRDRLLDLGRVRLLALFVARDDPPRRFVVDHARLE